MLKKVIIFDFDGVIVDTIQLSYSANKDLLPDLELSEWRSWSNGNFHAAVAERADLQFLFSGNNIGHYRNKYNKGVLEIPPINGISEVVHKLHKDYILAIISSNSQGPIESYLQKYNLFSYFSDILGEETHKSKVVKFQMIVDKHKIEPDEILIITDSLGDIIEANEAGIKSIGVIWGVHDSGTLNRANPHLIVASPSELVEGVKSVIGV